MARRKKESDSSQNQDVKKKERGCIGGGCLSNTAWMILFVIIGLVLVSLLNNTADTTEEPPTSTVTEQAVTVTTVERVAIVETEATPTLMASLHPTSTLTDTPPTSTPLASDELLIKNSVAPVRDEPSGFGSELRDAGQGDVLKVVGVLPDGEWYLLADGGWVHERHVSNAPTDLAVVTPTPTPTRIPTNTPTATNTSIPTPTTAEAKSLLDVDDLRSEEREYIDALQPIMKYYTEAFDQIGQNFTEAGENPLLIFDEEWILSSGVAVAFIREANSGIRSLAPPPRLADNHALIAAAADQYDIAVDNIIVGIDNIDEGALNVGLDAMLAGNELINTAAQALETIVSEGFPEETSIPASENSSASQANRDANLREGPGVNYDVAGGVTGGQRIQIVGQNSAGDWLQLANGLWIAAYLVNNAPGDLSVTATNAFLPGGNPTPVAADSAEYTGWSKYERGIEFRSDCPCDQGDMLNCGDFTIGYDAQACWLKCMEETERDVHGLDRDADGSACEWSW